MSIEARAALGLIGENNMSTTIQSFNPTRGEIVFNPLKHGEAISAEPLSVSNVMAEAQSIISQAQTKTVEELLPRPVLNPTEVIQQATTPNIATRSSLPAQSLLMLAAAHTFLPTEEEAEEKVGITQKVTKKAKILGFGEKVAGFLKVIKPQPVTEVVARIVKKQEPPVQLVPAVTSQKAEENTIEDLGLSEVFPKAA